MISSSVDLNADSKTLKNHNNMPFYQKNKKTNFQKKENTQKGMNTADFSLRNDG